jgi:dipeptidyl aminopeptidase/acylaminoacyl peptidase
MKIAPYGAWSSPIDAETSIASGVGLSTPVVDYDNIYWLESRPAEKGRIAIMRRSADGTETELIAAPFSARSRVHEYGGGAYAVSEGIVLFSNDADGRIYKLEPDSSEPLPLTRDVPDRQLRYAAFAFDHPRNRILAVREDHRAAGEAVNTIVAISLDAGDDEGTLFAAGHDFIGPVAINPTGTHAAWIAWDHPNMPWDDTFLYVAELDAHGFPIAPTIIAGEPQESVVLPEWADDDTLIFISDRSEYWNLYRYRVSDGSFMSLAARDAEFAYPQWKLGMTSYAILDANTILATSTALANWSLELVDISTGASTPVRSPYTVINGLTGGDGVAVFLGASATCPHEICRYDLETGEIETIKQTKEAPESGYISVPEPIEFPTEGGLTAHAFFYAPTNRDFTAPNGELPPLVVLSHGGPTGSTELSLDLEYQFWTSRGFALVDVNYGGSTGYGRAYRERLRDTWGVVDIDDCVNAAKFLIERGDVDPDRITIRGWSASGYTTLAALTFRDFFKAGASHFGISELSIMATETHKFESRYLDGLLGAYPEAKATYDARSPINFVDDLNCPLILFQGLEDKVVPPNQAEMMFEAVKAKGIPVAYVAFEGEQHGFRQKENIIRAIEGELYFLSRVFNFPLAESIEPVEIANDGALPG